MENTEGQNLKNELFTSQKTGWEGITDEVRNAVFKFADEYMDYLNCSKTEKEIVKTSKDILEKEFKIDCADLIKGCGGYSIKTELIDEQVVLIW